MNLILTVDHPQITHKMQQILGPSKGARNQHSHSKQQIIMFFCVDFINANLPSYEWLRSLVNTI